uniref:Uncharacterized protein n=1 Tax=Lepeophtheirus salmonis TaxID=72036 RepID=A0A0K2UBZ9_LEPSM
MIIFLHNMREGADESGSGVGLWG